MHITKIPAAEFNAILKQAEREAEADRCGYGSHEEMVTSHRNARRRAAKEALAERRAMGLNY
jgi:hypothetical protein